MNNLSQIIRGIRKERNLTQSQLGRLIDVTGKTISLWESNLRTPRLDDVQNLADALEIPVALLLGSQGEGEIEAVRPVKKPTSTFRSDSRSVVHFDAPVSESAIPILGEIPAGYPNWAEGDTHPVDTIEGSSRDKGIGAFALRVVGDSMTPRYEHGDCIFLKPLNLHIPIKGEGRITPRAAFDGLRGRTVAVLINNEATLKKLNLHSREESTVDYWLDFVALNQNYPTIRVQADDDVRIQGVVYKLVRENL